MEILNFVIFTFLALTIILSAFGVVFSRALTSSLWWMMICFLGVAGVFFFLNSAFIGASQIILYGVSVAILMVFAIMLISKKEDKKMWVSLSLRSIFAFLSALSLFFIIMYALSSAGRFSSHFALSPFREDSFSSVSKIASELFSTYILTFEVLSLLLLALIVGAAVIARREK